MDAQTELKRIAHELRAYNPAADEYKGKHIHGVWAREIDAVLTALSDAGQAPDLSRISAILASEIECSVFEKDVQPALDVARKVLDEDAPPEPVAWKWRKAGWVNWFYEESQPVCDGAEIVPLYAAPVAPAMAPNQVTDEMDAVAIDLAHRMALELECVLVEATLGFVSSETATRALDLVSDYRTRMNAIHERVSPTFMGEPVIPPKGARVNQNMEKK